MSILGRSRPAVIAALAASVLTAGFQAERLQGQSGQDGQPPAGGGQAPSFRVGVDVVSLNVTVTDGTARYLTDLEPEAHGVPIIENADVTEIHEADVTEIDEADVTEIESAQVKQLQQVNAELTTSTTS